MLANSLISNRIWRYNPLFFEKSMNNLQPLALQPEMLIRLLQKSGCREMSEESLQKLIDAGLPLNGDGTINIIEYLAWLIKGVNGNGAESV